MVHFHASNKKNHILKNKTPYLTFIDARQLIDEHLFSLRSHVVLAAEHGHYYQDENDEYRDATYHATNHGIAIADVKIFKQDQDHNQVL